MGPDTKLPDMGHLFIYVRNDETGESAYFDYYVQDGYTILGKVDEDRLKNHASLTVETSADQEQAILNGIKEMQETAPNYDLIPNDRNGISTCTNTAVGLLNKGGINPGDFGNRHIPKYVWESLFKQNAPNQTQKQTNYTGNVWHEKTIVPAEVGRSYGKDPNGSSRRVDPSAVNNRELRFRDGKRQN